MPPSLRQAWTRIVQPADYDAHMAAVGQAQANADLVAELFRIAPPPAGSAVLVAGAGTGQMFDHLAPDVLLPFRTTFTDLNAAFLQRLASRLRLAPELAFTTVVDDIERSSLTRSFDLAIAILVLEHVDWRRAVACLCRVSTARVFTGIQENPAAPVAARTLPGSMSVLAQIHRELIDRGELEREFQSHGFGLRRIATREVADSKKMVGLEFQIGEAG